MSDDRERVGDYGLVMPFVVTASHDGPYADDAFVAGWEGGWLDAMLAASRSLGVTVERYVSTPLVPQLDLVAMRHGYKVTAEPWADHPDEWTHVTFEPAETSS